MKSTPALVALALALGLSIAGTVVSADLDAAAVTAASSVIGPIIPPSGIMIIYAYVMGESVAALFLAGIVPGVLVGVGLMVMVLAPKKRK